MAEQQPGFFDQLRGGSEDLNTLASRQREAQLGRAGSRTFNQYYGLGSQAGSGLGRFGAQAIGKGQEARDNEAAHAAGISVNEVRSRRRLQKELSLIEDDGTFKARHKMAQMAAKIANEEGDAAGLARALSAVQRLNEEEAEWDKLSASKVSAQNTALKSGLTTGYGPDGDPATGQLGLGPNGEPGMWVEENGELVHRPWGEDFTLVNPGTEGGLAGMTTANIAHQLKINNGTGVVGKVKGMYSSASAALNKTDRVLSTLVDLADGGGVDAVMSTSGGLVSWVDNVARNTRGFLSAVAGVDREPGLTENGEVRSFTATREGWTAIARSAHWLNDLIQLPEGMERASAAAQEHRALVMEMAYMAARLAEPSNRGLSDNDIKNALLRIAGDTSNPQTMMRRFLGMQFDAYRELDDELAMFHGSLGAGVSDEQINTALLGKGWNRYNSKREELFDKFGATVGADGRITFEDQLSEDVQPGETIDPASSIIPQEDISFLDENF